MTAIQIIGAMEGNLKNVSIDIPKNKLVVCTGLSGSGKSTLLIDVLFHECQRQYLEAMSLQGIQKPKVERIRGASPAILISQSDANKNPRSTVGTVSDIYTDLRMVYEKLGVRQCPYCGATISAAECKETTEKKGNDFFVYMDCRECGKRMDKITCTHFSFNTREGACAACDGLGKVHTLPKEKAVDETLSPEAGAVRYWEKQYGDYQTGVLYAAFAYYGVKTPAGTPVCEYSDQQKALFYHGVQSDEAKAAFPGILPPKTAAQGRFEGVLPILWRRFAEKNGDPKQLALYFDTVACQTCKGERLGPLGGNVTVNGTRLPELSNRSLEALYQWVANVEASLPQQHLALVKDYLLDIQTKLLRFLKVGLGYLSLDRTTITLSGGELQRLRLASVLDSELSGVIYLLDEPTAGLHPKDTAGLIAILRKLRDLGNTVLVIEHDEDVMACADELIDIGPGAGKQGGRVVATGTREEIKNNPASVTGQWLCQPHPGKAEFRKSKGAAARIENADQFNLKRVSVEIPLGCLTAVTGPSGSGKSTLVFEVLAKGNANGPRNRVSGLEQFDQVVQIEQSAIARMKRSNVATFSDVYADIRTVFAKTEQARKAGLTAKHFSFNTPGGRCENCQGLGMVDSHMLFFNDIEVDCPVCGGNRFSPQVLGIRYEGLSITDVLHLSVEEAAGFFQEQPKIQKIMRLLMDVGLGYLELGQTLTTLSGGEGQRLKLARELIGNSDGKRNLYLMDEPTTGLHPKDAEHFLALLDRMVDAGHTVIVVEHNRQAICHSDWVIDLGPEGGEKGGEVLFAGTPEDLKQNGRSATALYL